jgi:CheY-like chemotaxis protein
MKKVSVLIADDNKDLLSSLQIQLLVHGYEVVTCTNADLAVAYAQKHRPDVILADIWMDADRRLILSPTGNGFGVLERIRKFPETSGIPVIYMTGKNAAELELRAKQLGAYALIHKPFNFGALLAMIDSAVKDCPCPGNPLAAEGNPEFQAAAAADVSKVSEV